MAICSRTAKERTPAEEHRMAQYSALHVVQKYSPATLKDVIRYSGLCEIRAQKALKDLENQKLIRKTPKGYVEK